MNFKIFFILLLILILPMVGSATTVSVNLTSVGDSYIDSGSTSLNFGTDMYSRFGYGYNNYYALVKFDTSTLPSGVIITNASFRYYVNTLASTGGPHYAYQITSSWTETGVTWSNKPTSDISKFVCNTVSPNTYSTLSNATLINLVKGWYNGTISNYGLYLYTTNTSYVDYFATRENSTYAPLLIVTYTTVINTLSGTVTDLQTSNTISGARVLIYKSDYTWSDEVKTNDNGVYSFGNLSDDTYYLIASKSGEYINSPTYYVTMNGTDISKNLILEKCTSSQDCFFNSHYVTFKFSNEWGNPITGVNVSVYESSSSTATYSSVTNLSDGAVNFLLKKDTYYRITFNKTSISYNDEINLFPTETEYRRVIWGATTSDRTGSVSYNLTIVDKNATTSYLNMSYIDTGVATTSINFWVKNATGILLYSNSSTASTFYDGYAVNDSKSLSYIWGFNATVNGDTFTYEIGKTFIGSGNLIDLNIEDKYYNWLAIIFLTGLALLFSKATNRNGYVIIPAVAMFLSWISWLNVNIVLCITVLVLGVIAYLRTAEKRGEAGL